MAASAADPQELHRPIGFTRRAKWVLAAALLITGISGMGGAAWRESPAQEQGEKEASTADVLAAVTSYDVEATWQIEAQGLSLTADFVHKALWPNCSSTMLVALGMKRQFICDGDSLWTIDWSARTFTAEQWRATPVTAGSGGIEAEAIMQPPYPFALPLRMLAPPAGGRSEFVGRDSMMVSGGHRACEVWRYYGEGESDTLTVWRDARLGVALKVVSVARVGGQAMKSVFAIRSVDLAARHRPEDFALTATSGIRRVLSAGKLLVTDSLENEVPTNVELEDAEGNVVATDTWRGQVVVLDFWATWCWPCVRGLPHLNELQKEYGDAIRVIGIVSETPGAIKEFLKRQPINYSILYDPASRAEKAYRVRSLPSVYILDAAGVVREQFVGLQTAEALRDGLGRMGVKRLERGQE